jgi:7,8-dihydropterin-6-yl-methyl-4-(beta-D-ribofuranosyl)aminobenzene 5'-phosphate synthase
MNITVLYNNVSHSPGCVCQWGFSCLIRGPKETILFDTGGDGRVLLHNMELLAVEPKEIDCLVLSHGHGDHTGGVRELLPHLKSVRWYIPKSFAGRFRDSLQLAGHTVVPVGGSVEICPGVFSTGQLGGMIKEQALILETASGLVVITGCAHPGIVEMTEAAHEQREQKVHLILGGFHLMADSQHALSRKIERLQALGVEKVSPSHCTGQGAMQRFAEIWQENCISSGCGARIPVS